MASPDLMPLWRAARAAQSPAARVRGLPPLWFMTDRDRVADPLTAAARLPKGAGVVLRDYDAPGRAALAAALAALCRRAGLVLLVAGDERLAAASGADGVHLPQWRAGDAAGIRRRHPSWLVTAAAHDARAIRRAARAGADAVFVSPVFSTASHPGAPHLGSVRFAALVRTARVPVYALGGVDAGAAGRLRASGMAGVAAIGGIAES